MKPVRELNKVRGNEFPIQATIVHLFSKTVEM